MAKRHTSQDTKQKLGQYFTTNSDEILKGYEHVILDKNVIDPFAGDGDLLRWAHKNGANTCRGYDIVPRHDSIVQNDSLVNPPMYTDSVLVTNPPYLSSNKCRTGDRTPYQKWNQSDYYKCHLATLEINDCDQALEIVPSNFFCESRDAIRKELFKTHHIVSAKIWNEPVFQDTTIGICVLHIKRGKKTFQQFPLQLLPINITIMMDLREEYNYLHGVEFFEYINNSKKIRVVKTDIGMPPPNTRLVVGLLDNGARPVGISFNESEPVYCQPKSFTTYQLTLPDYNLSDEQQREIVDLFQAKLRYYREKYHSMFLSNYMGPTQKILSRNYVHGLLGRVMMDLNIVGTVSRNDLRNELFQFD